MEEFIPAIRRQFESYKQLGERAMAQLSEDQLNWKHTPHGNSIAIIVKHMQGNMRSRFTDFLTTDGEKPWRQRDEEFEEDQASREQVMQWWNEGWQTLYTALDQLTAPDLHRTVHIRSQPLSVMDALLRQLAHYASHVGQVILLAKHLVGERWETLSIGKRR